MTPQETKVIEKAVALIGNYLAADERDEGKLHQAKGLLEATVETKAEPKGRKCCCLIGGVHCEYCEFH